MNKVKSKGTRLRVTYRNPEALYYAPAKRYEKCTFCNKRCCGEFFELGFGNPSIRPHDANSNIIFQIHWMSKLFPEKFDGESQYHEDVRIRIIKGAGLTWCDVRFCSTRCMESFWKNVMRKFRHQIIAMRHLYNKTVKILRKQKRKENRAIGKK
jgi:hypothetical protein